MSWLRLNGWGFTNGVRDFSSPMKMIIRLLFLIFLFPWTGHTELAEEFRHLKLTSYQAPEFLTYDELVTLSKNPNPGGGIEKKVEKLFNTPFLSNEAAFRGARPKRPIHSHLGPILRVVQWNIEKSMKMQEAIWAFSDVKSFAKLIDTSRFGEGSKEYLEVLKQRALLEDADVIILQEMDIGMKRSEYRNAVKDLAEALNMNYVYAAEQL